MKDKPLSPKTVRILEAARQVLAEHGTGQFSMRNVAKSAEIHLKTLQHYFPTKAALLKEVVEYTLRTYYLAQYQTLFSTLRRPTPEKKLETTLKYIFRDAKDTFTINFFTQLWALAAEDQDASNAVDILYTSHRLSISEMIREVNPSLSEKAARQRGLLIAAMVEGLIAILGESRRHHRDLRGLESEFVARAFDIVWAPE